MIVALVCSGHQRRVGPGSGKYVQYQFAPSSFALSFRVQNSTHSYKKNLQTDASTLLSQLGIKGAAKTKKMVMRCKILASVLGTCVLRQRKSAGIQWRRFFFSVQLVKHTIKQVFNHTKQQGWAPTCSYLLLGLLFIPLPYSFPQLSHQRLVVHPFLRCSRYSTEMETEMLGWNNLLSPFQSAQAMLSPGLGLMGLHLLQPFLSVHGGGK